MVEVRAGRLPQKALLIIGRGGRKVTTLVAILAHRQPSITLPVLLGCLTFVGVTHAMLACHGGQSLVEALGESFVEMTEMEEEQLGGPRMGTKDMVVGDSETRSGRQRGYAILDVERRALGHLPHQTQPAVRSTTISTTGWLS
jgi:hypothetical protein